ncbi:hypothetical protein MRX96_006962 [Rhipicephalus microplus]
MAESADRKFRREINRRVNASFQLIDSEADVINDTRYVDRDSRNAERESDLPSEACAVDLEDGHRRLCVHDRERPSAHSSIVPETDVPQGHVLISGDACYPSGCSVSVPHDHTDFERRAFHDSSAAASTSATSQVRQRDSFELAPTGSNEEQVCERGSVDSLLAFRERLQAWALQSRASHTSVTSLLRVLQSHECFSALPSTARALLQTPKKCLEVLQLAGGKYHHFGLSAGLQRVLQDCAELPRILKLSFNIDGLPVSKSSRGQFWCILGRISQYVVVLFPEEDDTSGIILKSWLKGDGCLWPRQTKYVHSLLKAKATPGADWIEVPCTVVREFDTYAEARANLPRGRKHKRPRNLENRPLPTQPRSLEHEGYADKAGRQPLQQHRTTGQEGALLTRSNISEVPAFDSSSPAGIRPSQRAPSPRMASPEGQNVYRGSYSNNCRPLDNLEGPPFQQHYSSQQGASWTAPNNCHEPGLGFPSTSSMPAQRAGYNEGQNVIRNSPTSRHTPSNSPSTRSIPFEHADNLERDCTQ